MELDLFDILSEKEEGTRLYSPICGDLLLHNVSLNGVFCKQPGVKTEKNFVFMSDGHLKNYGEWADRGECLLFPNKEMRDWEKYCWKRGDVVINVGGGITAIFDGWENDSFTKFNTVYSYEAQDSSYNEDVIYNTADFRKENDGGRARFIANLEKEFNGKFNPDTLEVEEKSMFKNGDFVYSEWAETDADGKVTKRCSWVGIFKSGCEKCYKSHAVYFFEKGMLDFEDTYADAQKTSRLATDLEKAKLLSNLERNGKKWNADKLCLEDIPAELNFNPFDKILGRAGDDDKWRADFFSHISDCLGKDKLLYVGFNDSYHQCVPYSGNEYLLNTELSCEKGGK